MTTARKALEAVRSPEGGRYPKMWIDAALTALAGHLRTPGTVEVCEKCELAIDGLERCAGWGSRIHRKGDEIGCPVGKNPKYMNYAPLKTPVESLNAPGNAPQC